MIKPSTLVSVIMPVRNGARWLDAAIGSLAAQTLTSFELVVVDDGSSDETPTLLQKFAKSDDRIHVIRQEPLGLVTALNRGLAEASAPLIARLDADDLSAPERLELQSKYLNEHPGIGLLGTWARKIDDSGQSIGWLKPETDSAAIGSVLERSNPMIHSSVMMRSDLVRQLGGYRIAFQGAEDYDLWLRIAEVTGIANLSEPLIQYRWHRDSVTNRQNVRQAFSVRLAQRSMKLRRDGKADWAVDLKCPPDWRSSAAEFSFYAEDAKLYRVLDLADVTRQWDPSCDTIDLTPLLTCQPELRHNERKLAATALARHLRHASWPYSRRTIRLLAGILRQRPKLAFRAILETFLVNSLSL